ncbi:MAG: hypothetical protein H6732_03625 [Alphaproteobacteria bacterium]|nr:hypothetical protein [Alphaproteobacteria bacterium]
MIRPGLRPWIGAVTVAVWGGAGLLLIASDHTWAGVGAVVLATWRAVQVVRQARALQGDDEG